MPVTTAVSDGFTVGADTSLTISHTSDSNPLYVLLSWYVALGGTDATDVMDGISFDGDALVRGGRAEVSGQTMEWWRLGTPTAGTADVVLSLNTSRRVTAAVLNLSGWPTAISDHTFAADGASSSPPSVDVSSRVGAEVIDWLGFNHEDQDVTVGSGATELWNQEGQSVTPGGADADQRSSGSLRDGASPTVTVSWTGSVSSEFFGLAALSFTGSVGRHLVTGYSHSVRGADNVISGRSNTVNADISHSHGEAMTVTGTRSVGYNLTDTPRTLADDDTFAIWADDLLLNGVAVTAGGSSTPTTTKGDVIVRSATADDRLPVGSDGQVLTADSSQTLGVKWAGGIVGDIMDVIFVRKASDESVTSNTTLQNDDELLFAIGATETWMFEFVLFVEGAAAGDFKVGLSGPTGSAGYYMALGMTNLSDPVGGDVAMQASSNYTTAAGFARGLSAGNVATLFVRGLVRTTGTSGTIQLVWAQNASNGTATTIKADSFLKAERYA